MATAIWLSNGRLRDALADSRASADEPPKHDTFLDADTTLAQIGARIRGLRAERSLTLQELGERTGLSTSMLSLVERGRAAPSIGTLVAISSALGIHMADLFTDRRARAGEPIVAAEDQRVFVTATGVRRQIARTDDDRGVEVALNDYEPGTSSGAPAHHAGYEYGVVLQGRLTVELDGATYELKVGDSIGYSSEISHCIMNRGHQHARAMWVNLDDRPRD